FHASNPTNRWRGFEPLGRKNRRVGADEADLCIRTVLLDGLGNFAVVLQRRRAGVNDDVVVTFRLVEALFDVDVVRRAVEQFGVRHERGRLREPGGIPEAGDFAPRLVTGAGAAVETVEGRR